ncbi:HdeD family acid-resistance protein [Corynebacterium pseudopelargi]|uniref:Acid-resistance membrane protein n=1 Tax=Corynebacterium pseudopelargi TaxID=2080757 RepID=A0A3G6J0T3_9CORY|nr:DUF308 domain-containing protein [Corynebacterium pseudopelargi]AZA09970.1 acid-resistance membrane protein [Corynebacterium pseudopelargi]
MITGKNWLALLSGVLFIIGGVLVFANPVWNMATLGWIFTFIVLVDAIVAIVDYFQRPRALRSGWDLALAILTLIIGIGLLGNSAMAQATIVPYLVGFWLIFIGAGRIAAGVVGPRSLKATLLITGTLVLLLGVAVMFNPLFSAIVLSYIFASVLIAFGVIRVLEFFRPAEG